MRGLLLLICFGLFIISCEDVIQVDLPEGEERFVVDAWLDNQEKEQVITLSSTQPYFENEAPPFAEDAVVTLTRDDGQIFQFDPQGAGRYLYDGRFMTLGEVGQTLQLDIVTDDGSYTASTMIHRVPPIDSIGVEFREDEVLSDDGYYANFYARDPVGVGDTYWIKTFRNGRYLDRASELNIAYDAGFDAGSRVDSVIFITPVRELINPINEDGIPSPYVVGDSIRVELHAISNGAFDFWDIAREQITNGDNGIFSLPLANTPTNIIANRGIPAVGYFDVANVSVAEYVVEE